MATPITQAAMCSHSWVRTPQYACKAQFFCLFLNERTNERRTTNDERRTTDDRRPTTDDGRPTTDDGRFKGSKIQRLRTNDEPTNDEPTNDDDKRTTNFGRRTMNDGRRTTDGGRRTTDGSKVQRFKGSKFQRFKGSKVQRFKLQGSVCFAFLWMMMHDQRRTDGRLKGSNCCWSPRMTKRLLL